MDPSSVAVIGPASSDDHVGSMYTPDCSHSLSPLLCILQKHNSRNSINSLLLVSPDWNLC